MNKKKLVIILLLLLLFAVGSVVITVSLLFGNSDYEGINHYAVAKMVAGLEEQFETVEYQNQDTYLLFAKTKLILPECNGGDELVVKELIQILEHYQISEIKYLTLNLNFRHKNKKVPKEVFYQAYRMIKDTIQSDVKEQDIMIVATPGTSDKVSDWTAYTDCGLFGFHGIFLDGYQDRKVKAFVKNNEILAVERILDNQITYSNAWIFDCTAQQMTAYVDGIIRTFYLDGISNAVAQSMADIYMLDGYVQELVLKTDTIEGKILSVTDDYVEIEKYGKVPFDKEYKFYRNYGNFGEFEKSEILVGYDLQEFIVADGKICGAVIMYPFKVENIRIMIRTTGFESIYHGAVTVSCDGEFCVLSGNELQDIEVYSAGEKVTFQKNDKRIKSDRVRVVPMDSTNRIRIESITRSQGTPAYPGYLEIGVDSQGLFVVNEVNFEEYLKLVVPSEMPAGYGVEAAKVQAVCARSYAYNQLLNNDYAEYGAHIDDSTWYQVYNNTLEYKASNDAVDATCGQVMKKDGDVITAYYYSTSCGHGSDIAIWGQSSDSCGYIKAHSINPANEVMDLTTNDAFLSFIKQKNDKDFDATFPLYRWKAYVSLEDMNRYYKANANVGTITSVDVIERLAGGTANEIVLTGDKGVYNVTGELNIRKFLGNSDINWTNNKGKKFSMASLPSGFFALEEVYKKDVLVGYNIIGGGYGHGLGMSQNGAYQMTKEGYQYDEILRFFYNDIELTQIY